MHPLIQFLIQTKGVSETTIVLLLMLPIVATIIAIWRQIIGLKTLGIYTPILVTFAFYQLGITNNGLNIFQGLKYGLTLAVIVFFTATITHQMTKKIRLHYLPKMSIILSSIAITIFGVLMMASYMDRNGFIAIEPLSILLMIIVSEQMVGTYIKKGDKACYMLTLNTLLLSTLMYLLVSWGIFQELILRAPYIPLLAILPEFIIGKWTGFRLKEYFRFKSILDQNEPS